MTATINIANLPNKDIFKHLRENRVRNGDPCFPWEVAGGITHVVVANDEQALLARRSAEKFGFRVQISYQ